MEILENIKVSGIVAVIRGSNRKNIVQIARALKKGGVTTLEITVETPHALSLIELVSAELGNDVIVGAGTVLDSETARAAIMSGAKFICSPIANSETIKLTKRYGVISIPGALTPTEILTAFEKGADIIKVFPARVLGPGYLKDIHGPLPHIPLMPTGGIDLNNIGDYIKAGAIAVGVGSTLVNTKGKIDEQELSNLTNKATKFIKEVDKARRIM